MDRVANLFYEALREKLTTNSAGISDEVAIKLIDYFQNTQVDKRLKLERKASDFELNGTEVLRQSKIEASDINRVKYATIKGVSLVLAIHNLLENQDRIHPADLKNSLKDTYKEFSSLSLKIQVASAISVGSPHVRVKERDLSKCPQAEAVCKAIGLDPHEFAQIKSRKNGLPLPNILAISKSKQYEVGDFDTQTSDELSVILTEKKKIWAQLALEATRESYEAQKNWEAENPEDPEIEVDLSRFSD